jgi:class 3 adenylate cyclase
LEKQLDENYGIDKLIILNQLTKMALDSSNRKAIKYGKQGIALADKLLPEEDTIDDEYYLKIDAYNLYGKVQYYRERYYDAKTGFQYALTEAIRINYMEGIETAETFLVVLDSIGAKSNKLKQAFSDWKIGQSIREGSQDISLSSTLRNAENNEKNGNYFKAIRNYEQAINYLKDEGDDEQIAALHIKIAECYDKAGNITKSIEYYKLAAGEKEKLGDTAGVQASKDSIENLQGQIVKLIDANVDSAVMLKKQAEARTLEEYRKLAEESEANEDYEQSLEYYKLYKELNDQMIEDEKEQELALLEKSYEIERNLQEIQLLTQDKEIQELELENKESEIEQQNRFRQNLIIGIALLLSLSAALYFLYINKRRDHKKLNIAHLDLQTTQVKLVDAEKRIKTLLDQQVSTEVARELLSESPDRNIQRKLVCVMFLDIRGFTRFAENRRPEDIIRYQNEVFGFMIDSVYKHNGIINQFLGDGFMATFGAPVSKGNDSEHAYQAAVEIINSVNEKSKRGEIYETTVGIGLHTGKVVVGNVGTSLRKQYSITGNAVIIAARIEQLNKEYGSQLLVSGEVLQHVEKNSPKPESLGEVQLKGREKPVKLYKVL